MLNELPQRGVSKIWHCPRLIYVHTYPFRSIQFVAAQTLCALQFVTFLLGRTKHNNSIAGERETDKTADIGGGQGNKPVTEARDITRQLKRKRFSRYALSKLAIQTVYTTKT